MRDKIIQLLECCDEELRKDLTRSAVVRLTEETEDDVLTAIRVLAVQEESVMVARVALYNMQQDRDEPIRFFGTRLRGQANICKYIMDCPSCNAEVNYTEPILRDVLCRGIIEAEIQLDLLGNTNQDMSLAEVFHSVEAKESGKRSASRLFDSEGVDSIKSLYRKNLNMDNNPTTNNNKTKVCSYCGKSGHGERSIAKVRSSICPAYDHTCKHCKLQHHFDGMCRSRGNITPKNRRTVDECEGAVFNTLCTITQNTLQNPKGKASYLDHHIYNQSSDTWKQKLSQPQPYINLRVEVATGDYGRLGFKNIKHPCLKHAMMPAMADTGCQSCLAGLECVQNLGLRKEDLIPVTMKMHAANNKVIHILGAAILHSGTNKLSETVETHQITCN